MTTKVTEQTSPVLFRMGSIITQESNAEGRLLERLPVGIYSINANPIVGYFLEPDFTITERLPKVYGDTKATAKRVLDTYVDRNCSTGAAFYGYKGTGKSLLVREICHNALDLGFPVILVNRQMGGEDFNKFISSITQQAVIVFEEFDKVYTDKDAVNSLLTLLDGLFNSNKLYLFSTNSALPEFLQNRPSRVYYSVAFGPRLSEQVITQYCEDRLNDQTRLSSILKMAAVALTFNFDMLQAVVEECNRYPEMNINDAVHMVNVDADIANVMFNLEIYNTHNQEVSGLYRYDSEIFSSETLIMKGEHYTRPLYNVNPAVTDAIIAVHEQYDTTDMTSSERCEAIDQFMLGRLHIPVENLQLHVDGSFTGITNEGYRVRATRSFTRQYSQAF